MTEPERQPIIHRLELAAGELESAIESLGHVQSALNLMTMEPGSIRRYQPRVITGIGVDRRDAPWRPAGGLGGKPGDGTFKEFVTAEQAGRKYCAEHNIPLHYLVIASLDIVYHKIEED